MESDTKSKLKIIIVSILGLFLLIIFFLFIKNNEILNFSSFYIIIFAISFLLIIVYFINLGVKKMTPKNPYIETNSFKGFISKVNAHLNQMNTSDLFKWECGDNTRITIRTFGVGKNLKTYKAMIGTTIKNKRKLIIYCVEDDAIVHYVGDTTNVHELNPFYGFKPRDEQYQPMNMPGMQNPQNSGGTRIIFNNPKQPNSYEQDVNNNNNFQQ